MLMPAAPPKKHSYVPAILFFAALIAVTLAVVLGTFNSYKTLQDHLAQAQQTSQGYQTALRASQGRLTTSQASVQTQAAKVGTCQEAIRGLANSELTLLKGSRPIAGGIWIPSSMVATAQSQVRAIQDQGNACMAP